MKKTEKKRFAFKFFQEIRTETRISDIDLKKIEKKNRLALKFSQEIRTETRISNFNLKGGSGPQHLRLGGYLGGFVLHYIPEGGCVPYFFPDRRFYSGQQILHFVIVTHDFIYLINLIGQK